MLLMLLKLNVWHGLQIIFFLPLARKPEKVDHIDAAGCIGDVVKAYTALHYQARVCSGETVLILNGASVSTIPF